MDKVQALALFNALLIAANIKPLSESEVNDWIYDGMSEEEVREAANDLISEEHTVERENIFWREHDWQNDYYDC